MKDYTRPLTEEFVRRRDLAPGEYYDREGLYLRIRKSGRKYWEHRFKFGGKLRTRDRAWVVPCQEDVPQHDFLGTRPRARGVIVMDVGCSCPRKSRA